MIDFDRKRDIWRLPVGADGTVGTWENAGQLPHALYASAAEVFGDAVYFFGGQNENDEVVDTIIAAKLPPDGRVTDAHELTARLSVARMHVHQTPVFGKWIYSVGGRDENDRSLGIVDVGTFE